MREIEVKARIKDKESLLGTLSEQGIELSAPIKQHDVVYYIPGTKDNAPGSIWLRLRTENDAKTIFTLKKQHKGELDSIEHETEVADAQETEAILLAMGYELYSDLTKTRQKGRVGEVEICVDDVEGLGLFIEAEKLAELNADGNQVETELWQLLDSFGVQRSQEVAQGYDVMHKALNKES